MSDFLMPALGADMQAGTVVDWLVKAGDRVSRGDVIAVVETQKGAIEVEIFDEGIVSEIVVPVGSKVPVGTVLARIGERAGPQAAPPAPLPTRPPPSPPAAAPQAPVTVAPLASPSPERARISPAARRRAAELGIDAATIAGSGVEGAVTVADVEALAGRRAATPAAAAAPVRRAGFDPAEMRRAIAAAMARSKREIPHYYLTNTVDLGPALAWLESFNAQRSVTQRLLPAALLLKASALALREVPQLNGTYTQGAFRPGDGIHMGWAISLRGGGLVAPAIRDTDKRPLPELMTAMRDLVGRARSGGLRSSELTLPTITVTSLGDRGADSVIGIIYPPQVALIGFGTISPRPWIADGQIVPRPLVTASLAGDHRASDGHQGGLLLNAIARLLQEPQKL
jgi:pyruvate dehydrogenase E2 component (dihydrolipoamide acetyltransferase)